LPQSGTVRLGITEISPFAAVTRRRGLALVRKSQKVAEASRRTLCWRRAGALRDRHIPAAMPYLDSAATMLGAYHDQLRPSRAGTIVPGLTLLELPGHTPGTCRLSFGLCRRDTRYLGRYRSCARNSGPAPAGDERMRHRRAAGCREPAMHLRSGRVGTLARRWRPSSYARLCAPCTRRRFLPLSS
jgi:hypothetical protein